MIFDFIAAAFLIVGTFFMLLGSIGLIRMPDFYTRIHAVTKSATLGIACLLVASVFSLLSLEAFVKVLLGISFHFLTNPVGAHMVTRAAYYHLKIPFWENTIVDEWKNTPQP